MEGKKYLILIFVVLCAFNINHASEKSVIYQAYVSNDMEKWKQTIDKMGEFTGGEKEFVLELINYQYGYIAWCIGTERNDEAESYLELAEENIKMLEEENYKPSVLNAYKAAFYGYRIGIDNYKAVYLGPRSKSAAQLALEQNPENWLACIQYGNVQYYLPEIFGGSKKEAIEYYLKAKHIMENSEQLFQNWNYLNLLVIIAKVYTEEEELDSAKIIYEEILKIEPDFLWVKDELYPDILKRIR